MEWLEAWHESFSSSRVQATKDMVIKDMTLENIPARENSWPEVEPSEPARWSEYQVPPNR